MYGAIRQYQLRPGAARELVAKIRAEFVPIVSGIPGFISYTVLFVGADELATTSVFEHAAGAEASVKAAAAWVNAELGPALAQPPRIATGEIPVRHVNDGVNPGWGVMRRFACTSENAALIAERVRAGLVPILDRMPGFASFGLFIENGRDMGGASLSAFADRATAENANERSLDWVKQNVGSLLTRPPDVVVGEIALRHAVAGARAT